MLSAIAPAAAAPDLQRGEQLYARCLACHALANDRVGPRHCGLFGRLAGSVPGFEYSTAMKNSNIRWDAQTLDRFLAKPLDVVPGTHDDLRRRGGCAGTSGLARVSRAGEPLARMRRHVVALSAAASTR